VFRGDWGLLASLIFFHQMEKIGFHKRKKQKEHVCRKQTSSVSNKKKGKEKEHVYFLQANIERQQINRDVHD